MATRQKLQEREVSGEAAEEVGEQAMGPAAMAAGASVGLALYFYYLKGDKERGIFVGLWPPTILAFASYFNQRKMSQRLDTLTQPGTTLKRTIDSVIGNS